MVHERFDVVVGWWFIYQTTNQTTIKPTEKKEGWLVGGWLMKSYQPPLQPTFHLNQPTNLQSSFILFTFDFI